MHTTQSKINTRTISVYDFLVLAQKMGLFEGTIAISPESKKISLSDVIKETEDNHTTAGSVDQLFSSILGDEVQHQVLKSVQKRSQIYSQQ